MKLNNNRLLYLAYLLETKGIKNPEIQGEIMDHLASHIEGNMKRNNSSFHDALDTAFEEFGEENLMEIVKHRRGIFRQKRNRIMKHAAMILLLFISAGAFSIYHFGNEPEDTCASKDCPKEEKPVIGHSNAPFPDNTPGFGQLIDKVPERENSGKPNCLGKPKCNPEMSGFIHPLAEGSFPDRPQAREHQPPDAYPVPGNHPIVSGFGMRRHPIHKVMKMHKGIDIRAPLGTPVVATSDGRVSHISRKKTGYGNMIKIRHDETYKTLYAQLSKIDVELGQEVKKGQKIGEIGSSGTSTGPHLHYEVFQAGENVNPQDYVSM